MICATESQLPFDKMPYCDCLRLQFLFYIELTSKRDVPCGSMNFGVDQHKPKPSSMFIDLTSICFRSEWALQFLGLPTLASCLLCDSSNNIEVSSTARRYFIRIVHQGDRALNRSLLSFKFFPECYCVMVIA